MSDDRRTLTLHNAAFGHTQWVEAWRWCKAMLVAGHKLCVEIYTAKSREQERLYHSCFRDLARDCLLGGQKRDEEDWKRATLQAFYEATKDDPDFAEDWKSRAPRFVPALDGIGIVMVPIESKRFTKKLATAYITFLHATGDERGVSWSRTSLGRDVPDEAFA